MPTECLYRDPRVVLASIEMDRRQVSKSVDYFRGRLDDNPSFQLSLAEVRGRLKTTALSEAREGSLAGAMEAVTAYDNIDTEHGISLTERLDLATLATLSQASHLLHHVSDLDGVAGFLFKGALVWAEDAHKYTDLPFDGFPYQTLVDHYFQPRLGVEPAKEYGEVTEREQDGVFRFFMILENAATGYYTDRGQLVNDVRYFERVFHQGIDPEIKMALLTLFSVDRALLSMYEVFLQEQRIRETGGRANIPENLQGRAYQELHLSRDFLLAKIEHLAQQKMGLDLSPWLRDEEPAV